MNGFSLKYNFKNFSLSKDFFISNRKGLSINKQFEQFEIQCGFNDKYFNDKVIEDNEQYLLILDGVITNRAEIYSGKACQINWPDFIFNQYKQIGFDFFKTFRGSFSGVLYSKKEENVIVFNDHIGTKPVYYYKNDDGFFVSTSMTAIYHFLKENGIPYNFNVNSAYMLLSYGYMLDSNTICSEILKLSPGCFIKTDNTEWNITNYYTLPFLQRSEYDTLSIEECIEELDIHFRKAVQRQFTKDREYNYTHFVALSGGLDSRMTTWVANDMGFSNQINFTFSQSNYYDEKIAKSIASRLKHDWLFKYLDNGLFLYLLDEVTELSGGNVFYAGLAHGYSMMRLINFDDLGMIHSGQLGDVIIGSFMKSLGEEKEINYNSGLYSNKLLDRVNFKSIKEYNDQEEFMMYQRAINGANSGLIVANTYTETMSPFYDVDFFEFCLHLPLRYRIGHEIYFQWILKKYPQAAAYVWEKTKRNLLQKPPISFKYKGKVINYNKIKGKIRSILFKQDVQENSMNPFDYWYNTSEDLRRFMDEYFEKNIELVSHVDDCLKNDLMELYKGGKTIEKTQVLSLLSTYKTFYS